MGDVGYASSTSVSEKAVPVKAQPPTVRMKTSLAFLFQIQWLAVTGTSVDGNGDACLLIDVILHDTATTEKTHAHYQDAGIHPTRLQIQRTFRELKELEKDVVRCSGKHYGSLPTYDLRGCTYCAHFQSRETQKLWPGTLSRLTTSKHRTERKFEVALNDYVEHARLPRPSDLECQGFDHIPSILARFLLKEMPVSEC
uniref:Uncharacterized protein n=1 Tax=Globisporangium ultimum (strain ATCC 200006 / CBS 805.95 / DAOM BR144) TaxID=431595 RepID=K3WBU7_GLOUD